MNHQDYSLKSFKGGWDNNLTYLVTCSQTRAQFLVDAAVAPEEIKDSITGHDLFLLITHTHEDHLAFIDEYIKTWPDLVICIHRDSPYRTSAKTIFLKDDDILKVGKLNIKSIFTPGHYIDSLCFQMAHVIFTGDTLFVGRTGRTISFGSDAKSLYKSIEKILTLPASTIIYPGHDYGQKPYITLEDNIRISPLLRASSETDFLKRMAEYESNR